MAKKGKILTTMLKDHGKIMNLLNKFEKSIDGDSDNYKETFNQFKWELKRHIVVEETAIFTYYNPKDEESYSMVPKLLNDHKEISEMLTFMEQELKLNRTIDTLEFRDAIMEHKEYEEEIFYPTLEKELDESQKKRIINQIETQI